MIIKHAQKAPSTLNDTITQQLQQQHVPAHTDILTDPFPPLNIPDEKEMIKLLSKKSHD